MEVFPLLSLDFELNVQILCISLTTSGEPSPHCFPVPCSPLPTSGASAFLSAPLCPHSVLLSQHTLCLNCLGLAVNLETMWLEVSEVKGQTAPQAFAAFKMESCLSKDGGQKSNEGCSYMVLYVQQSSYIQRNEAARVFYILHENYFVSQCCCSPIIETRIMFTQHYLKHTQLVTRLKSVVDSQATHLKYVTEIKICICCDCSSGPCTPPTLARL